MNFSNAKRRSIAVICLTFAVVANAPAVERLQATTRAALSQNVEFDVFLPLENTAQLDQLLEQQHTPGSPLYQKWLTPADFRSRFGPSAATLAKVTAALRNTGVTVLSTHSHGLHVSGSVDSIQNTFGATLWNVASKSPIGGANAQSAATTSMPASNLITTSPLQLPSALAAAGATVAHFSPMIRQRPRAKMSLMSPDNRYSNTGGYWFDDLKQAYAFPSYLNLTGRGVTVGILMSSDYNPADMTLYFGHEKLAVPTIVRRPVLGGAPFSTSSDGSFEVELDIQQAGGMAPKSTVALYNIPDLSDEAIIAGYLAIIEDNQADIVSSSFGGSEAFYLPEYNGGEDFSGILKIYQDIFRQGNAQGITFVASSGDFGAVDVPPPGYFFDVLPGVPKTFQVDYGVDFPASCPGVTGVGGTNLITTYNPPSLDSKYLSENAYGDAILPYDPYGTGNLVSGGLWGSGGGKSRVFAKPSYQTLVKTNSRTRAVPDVSLQMGGCPGGIPLANGCPTIERSYSTEYFGGKLVGVIGTSVSSPGFAGLLALKEQYVGHRLGNVNYEIYILAAGQAAGVLPYDIFHNDISGYNGYYTQAGYNFVVGNGTVRGRNFILAPQIPVAGTPQTPSNP